MLIHNEECYVAFVDILGFKDYVDSEDPEQILKMFQDLIRIESKAAKDKIRVFADSEKQEKYNQLSDKTYIYIMSDSVIMAIPSNIPDGFEFIVKWCKNIQVALLNKFRLTSRGGISKGVYYGDGTINFGRGMVSAVLLETLAEYPRIIIAPELAAEAKKLEGRFNPRFDVQTAIDEKDGRYYIDYLADFTWDAQTRQQIQSLIQKWKNSGDDKVSKKYEWLEEHAQQKIDEYEEMIFEDKCAQAYFESEEYRQENRPNNGE